MRNLTYVIAATLDGCIATVDGDTSQFEQGPGLIAYLAEHLPETLPSPARTHLGIDAAPPARFDTVVMGRHAYDVGATQGLTSPYAHLDRQIVCSTTLDPAEADPAIELWHDDLVVRTRLLKEADGRDIWLCGGGVLAGAIVDEIDELVIKRQPFAMGAGRPLFARTEDQSRFELVSRLDVAGITIETHRRI